MHRRVNINKVFKSVNKIDEIDLKQLIEQNEKFNKLNKVQSLKINPGKRNKLPHHIVEAHNLNNFKVRINGVRPNKPAAINGIANGSCTKAMEN